MKRKNGMQAWICAVGLLAVFLHPGILSAAEKIKIVATSSVIADLTYAVTGDEADIHSVASPKRDIHFIEPTPVDVLRIKKADVLVHGGLDLEVWRAPLLDAAGNTQFLGEAPGAIDVSHGVSLLEVPASVSRTMGDIHLYGNPHYWTDPVNAKVMVRTIAEALSKRYPEKAAVFIENAKAFDLKLNEALQKWQEKLKPYKGMAVVTYHKSWPYFLDRFGLVSVGELEPKPGIPPTAKHLVEIIRLIHEKKVKVIIRETFQESRTPDKLAKQTGAKAVMLFQQVHEGKNADNYIAMMDHNVRVIEEALKS